jgi:YfiH family protein
MILPRVGRGFQWRLTAFGPALVCLHLEVTARHLFTTRPWKLGSRRTPRRDAWTEVATACSASSLLWLNQVHGRAVAVAERVHLADGDDLPDADIAVSATSSKGVAVRSADCVPILLADRQTGAVAAAHAGWRGLAQGVPRLAVAALTDEYGSNPTDLVAALGPSVGACCYEVGPDVREAFSGHPASGRWFSEAPLVVPNNPPMAGLGDARRPGHAFFDGWTATRDQLIEAGFDPVNIHTVELCTASHPDVCCSYRADGQDAGRMAAAITPSLRP